MEIESFISEGVKQSEGKQTSTSARERERPVTKSLMYEYVTFVTEIRITTGRYLSKLDA